VNEITSKLIEATGADVEPKHAEPVQGEVRRIFLNVDLAEKELNWKAKTSLADGLAETVSWVRKQ